MNTASCWPGGIAGELFARHSYDLKDWRSCHDNRAEYGDRVYELITKEELDKNIMTSRSEHRTIPLAQDCVVFRESSHTGFVFRIAEKQLELEQWASRPSCRRHLCERLRPD